jgi:hypothetical protein
MSAAFSGQFVVGVLYSIKRVIVLFQNSRFDLHLPYRHRPATRSELRLRKQQPHPSAPAV